MNPTLFENPFDLPGTEATTTTTTKTTRKSTRPVSSLARGSRRIACWLAVASGVYRGYRFRARLCSYDVCVCVCDGPVAPRTSFGFDRATFDHLLLRTDRILHVRGRRLHRTNCSRLNATGPRRRFCRRVAFSSFLLLLLLLLPYLFTVSSTLLFLFTIFSLSLSHFLAALSCLSLSLTLSHSFPYRFSSSEVYNKIR